MNGKREPQRKMAEQMAEAAPLQAWQSLQSPQHLHRPREFGVGYGNSSGYGHAWHFVDGHVDPMFRCV